MAVPAVRVPLQALLIGVDHYLPGRSLAMPHYPSLTGAVADLHRMQALLTGRLGVEESAIRCLTATVTPEGKLVEPATDLPTYENIVAALHSLRDGCVPGGQVLIHFSGHGGRTPTLAPRVKGAEALDECLVPYNISQPRARYLRDLEIAHFLREMVEAGAFVTLLLDCCHSGGATRSTSAMGSVAARGIGLVDRLQRPSSSVLTALADLRKAWPREEARLRGMSLARTWSLIPTGYVLLAACRPQEWAFEANFGGQRGGALTYWFLDALHGGGGLTYKQVYDRLVGRIHSRFPTQTPQIEGEADRLLFGRDVAPALHGINVLTAEEENGEGQVVVNTGQAHGLREGARLAIHRGDAPDPALREERLAILEITEVGAVTSVGKIRQRWRPERPPRAGDQGVLVASGPLRVRRPVRWADPMPEDGTDPAFVTMAREKFQRALAGSDGGFLEGGQTRASAETLWVSLNRRGHYEIRDGSGSTLPNLLPDLNAGQPGTAGRTLERLVHLAKYRNIQELENPDLDSTLRGGVALEISSLPDSFRPGDAIESTPFQRLEEHSEKAPGDLLCLTITNCSLWTVNITVLDLQPNWAVSQLFPSVSRGMFEPLDSNSSLCIPLRVELPQGCEEGTDLLRVFATLGPTNFRFLELPAIGSPSGPGMTIRATPSNHLERLLAAVAGYETPLRGSALVDSASSEWTVEQVEVRVRRK